MKRLVLPDPDGFHDDNVVYVPDGGSSDLDGSPPSWWHHHGRKMQIRSSDFEKGWFVLSSHPNEKRPVAVFRGKRVFESYPGWLITYQIRHLDGFSFGSVRFSDDDLALAFGVVESAAAIEQAESAGDREAWVQGKFMRHGKRYLNIPMPGTGSDGDPNISVYLWEEVTQMVAAMIVKHAVSDVRTLAEMALLPPLPDIF